MINMSCLNTMALTFFMNNSYSPGCFRTLNSELLRRSNVFITHCQVFAAKEQNRYKKAGKLVENLNMNPKSSHKRAIFQNLK